MNLFLPVSLQAVAELEELMMVDKQLITPQRNSPVMGLVQDSLVTIRIMTQRNVFISRNDAMQILYAVVHNEKLSACLKKDDQFRLPTPTIVKPVALWTGKQFMSMLFPKDLQLDTHSSFADEDFRDDVLDPQDTHVRIRDGELLTGTFDKKTCGSRHGSLVHIVNNDYGGKQTLLMLDGMMAFGHEWMMQTGFSVGLDDVVASEKTRSAVKEVVSDTRKSVHELGKKMERGELENMNNKTIEQTFEFHVNDLLNKARDRAGNLAHSDLPHTNALKRMESAGSKGNKTNIAQMAGIVGQQNLTGQRIPLQFAGRAFPHCVPEDTDDIVGRGFVEHSYIEGLSPLEMFTHAIGGREGLTDTACKSVTGDTPVFIFERKTGALRRVQIGPWIDSLMDDTSAVERVERHGPEQKNLEYFDILEHSVMIPTADQNGKASWAALTAVTRHDPGEILYRITTEGGRSVIVTSSKSVIAYDEESGTLEQIRPQDLVVGKSMLPVVANLTAPPVGVQQTRFCIKNYLLCETDVDSLEALEYTRETGVMFGLFLAKGSIDEQVEQICVTSNRENVQNIVQQWFRKFDIKHTKTHVRDGNETITTTINGCSTLLAHVFKHAMGHLPTNKRVPPECFTAPDEFVIGLIDGYLSEDGIVTDTSISFCSVSEELIDGIALLLNRFAVFGNRFTNNNNDADDQYNEDKANIIKNDKTVYCYSAIDQFAKRLKDTITFVGGKPTTKIEKMQFTDDKRNYSEMRDVVLEKVKIVEKVPVTDYPKVYDVTVPSTIRFCAANNLVLFDTADTGYLQRRLIKAMEDLYVAQDKTVRDSTGSIIQFAYGEDDMDGVAVENQRIELLSMDNEQLLQRYYAGGSVDLQTLEEAFPHAQRRDLEKLANSYGARQLANDDASNNTVSSRLEVRSKDEQRLLREELIRMAHARDLLRDYVFRERSEDTHWPLAGNVRRVIGRAQHKSREEAKEKQRTCNKNKNNNDKNDNKNQKKPQTLTISDVVQGLMYFCEQIWQNGDPRVAKDDKFSEQRQLDTTCLFIVQVLSLLSPKRTIVEYALTAEAFQWALQELIRAHLNARVDAGESVGVVAGQSIGEPATQMTLNSVDYEECIVLASPDGNVRVSRIGEFIEKVIENRNDTVIEQLPNDTTYADVGDEKWYVPNVDENGHTSWNLVEAVTKHPPINKDGTNTLLKVRTVGGRSITATKAKSFLVRVNNKIVGVDGESLKVGDYVPATEYIPAPDFKVPLPDCLSFLEPSSTVLTAEFGFVVGAFLADGNCSVADEQVWFGANDSALRRSITDWCDTYSINYYVEESSSCCETTKGNGTKVRLCSTNLCDMLVQLCGSTPQEKHVPPLLVFTAPPECLRGFLDGYFSSIATISIGNDSSCVSASSSSSLLIDGVCAVLSRFCIYARRRSTTSDVAGQKYKLTLENGYAKRFSNKITLTARDKQDLLETLAKQTFQFEYYKDDFVPGVVSSVVCGDVHRDEIVRLAQRYPNDEAIHSASCMDVIFDRIESIEEVQPTRAYVYDLTVANTRNFALFNGLHCRDTFHSAGISGKNVTLGLPRLEELMKATKNIKTPSLTLYLTPDERRKDPMQEADRARLLANRLQYTRVKDLVQSSKTLLDPLPGSTIVRDRLFVERWYETEPPPYEALGDWIVRLELDREAMAERDFSVTQIAMILRQAFSTSDKTCVYVVASDDSDVTDKDGGIIRLRVFQSAITKHIDMSMPDPDTMPDPEAIRRAKPEEWHRMTLQLFAENLEKHVLDMYVGGIHNIHKVHARQVKRIFYDPRTGKPKENNKEWLLETEGSSMLEVMALAGIDGRRVVSNNPVEVAKVLGIEVARDILLEEIRAVMSFYGLYVNYRHLALLCDFMTHNGMLRAISRHTLNKRATGALMRCTFEEPVDTLHRAALESHVDTLNSVSQAVMFGKTIPHGTGMVHTILDDVSVEMHRPKRQRVTYLQDNFSSNPFDSQTKKDEQSSSQTTKSNRENSALVVMNPFDCDTNSSFNKTTLSTAKNPFDDDNIGLFDNLDQPNNTNVSKAPTGTGGENKATQIPRIVAHNPFALEQPLEDHNSSTGRSEQASGGFLSVKYHGGSIMSDRITETRAAVEDLYFPSSPRRATLQTSTQTLNQKEDNSNSNGNETEDHIYYTPSSPRRL